MTSTMAHPGHHISTKSIAAAFAGAALAATAGFGLANVLLDEGTTLEAPAGFIDPDTYDLDRYPGFDPHGFAGTDREDRSYAHRDSWEGGIGPDARPGPGPTVHDHGLPEASAEQLVRMKLEQHR